MELHSRKFLKINMLILGQANKKINNMAKKEAFPRNAFIAIAVSDPGERDI